MENQARDQNNTEEELIIKKGDLAVIITYTGEQVAYNTLDEFDEEAEWGPEVNRIRIETKEGKSIDLNKFLPEDTYFVGPVDTGECFYDRTFITFDPLDKNGALLGLLHEIGHAVVLDRGTEGVREDEVKNERHAWGWALGMLHELKRQGIDLEPEMDRVEVKDFIKESLVSHEIIDAEHEGKISADTVEPYPLRYWQTVSQEYMEQFVDKIYKDTSRPPEVSSEALRRTFQFKR
ncbi:MAG: hypothetical protein ABH835_04190 [Patescibacteria group bacterium]|nr:hypothetical protein [Patescibacteria group bacterium]